MTCFAHYFYWDILRDLYKLFTIVLSHSKEASCIDFFSFQFVIYLQLCFWCLSQCDFYVVRSINIFPYGFWPWCHAYIVLFYLEIIKQFSIHTCIPRTAKLSKSFSNLAKPELFACGKVVCTDNVILTNMKVSHSSMVFRGVQSRTQNSIVLDYFQLWNYLKRNKNQAKLQLPPHLR